MLKPFAAENCERFIKRYAADLAEAACTADGAFDRLFARLLQDQNGAKTTDMIVGPAKFTTGGSESFATSLDFASGGGFAGGVSPMSSATWAPEPTSGILMLVGFGALALRRRKA